MVDEAGRDGFTRASWANVLGNAVKIVVEGAVGLAFGSVALVADAAHSIADLVASVVVLVWGRSSFDEPDDTHPHGHERIEPLTALFVGAVIALLGLNLLYESAQGVAHGVDVVFHPLLLGALAFAIVDMYLVYRYTEYINEAIGSTALEALATDCLNDIYTSFAAVVGVLGVLLGFPLLDPIAGGLVSLLVIYQGVEIGRENVGYLVGASPGPMKRAEVTEILRDHPAVEGIHDLTVFYDGPVLEVEVHVEVDGDMPFRQAHDVESELVASLRGIEDVGDAHVHLDPSGIGEWKDRRDR
ncbi:cation diffusion facilitator family transporter [Natronococcus amylolyticus DSM 10524]|uniref:Cation diffusion facilitator family transporter n=1 Tax=Natronococcus amylolyticus DSM 10524 TaxID=1227497 RepID=L9XDT7_9EURY|nr:cation diffusion facilitator family transporter [Natronococcus amylolyticus]ELY59884.1 cation diffusion facilitator family transporter [Natronococcus amylolyticus DSM 10524]